MAVAPLTAARDFLPRGGTLDDEAFARRHRWLVWLLVAHVPALAAYGLARGFGVEAVTLVLGPAVLGWLGARQRRPWLASLLVAGGLAACSGALVRMADGAVEARFHVFLTVALVALYQRWAPLLLVTVVGASPIPWPAGDARPGSWAALNATAVLAAFVAQVLVWRATDQEQRRSARLAAELARSQSQVEARESVSELFVNLARRNQSLLDRQINLIVAMQEGEFDPDRLGELFELDHLATRIRRNAESLLVLSGEEPSRRWGRPIALTDVVRAAIAEVEDYRRTDVSIDESVAVVGRAVADVAHLLAELIENGLQFSPPDTRVRVVSALRADGGCTVTVEDRGIGLTPVELASANELLACPPEVDLRLSKRLGFHVVSRLAARDGLQVALALTPGGGVTATVSVPAELLGPVEPAMTAPPATTVRARASRPGFVPTVAGRRLTDVVAPTAPTMPAPGPASAPAPAAREPAPPRSEPIIVPIRPPAVPAAASAPAPSRPGGLARRVPQASLHPQMLTGGSPAAIVPTAADDAIGRRSPDEVRSTLSRFQAGQARGRLDAREEALARQPEGEDQ